MRNKERADKQDYNTLEEEMKNLDIDIEALKTSEKVENQRKLYQAELFLDMIKESMKKHENI